MFVSVLLLGIRMPRSRIEYSCVIENDGMISLQDDGALMVAVSFTYLDNMRWIKQAGSRQHANALVPNKTHLPYECISACGPSPVSPCVSRTHKGIYC